MHSTTSAAPAATTAAPPALRPLLVFGGVAVTTGWVLLSVPLLLDLPAAPFVLATTFLGLLVPALALSRHEPRGARALLRSAFRRPPLLVAVPALLAVPAATWLGARAAGAETNLDADLLVSLAVNVVSSVLIINLWEELAWTGFFQHRAMARWGTVRGSLATAALFAAIHLPLGLGDDPLVGVAALAVAGVGLRLLVAAVWSWSGRSVMTVALLHASWNAASELVEADHDWVRYAAALTLGLLVLLTPVAQRGVAR
jgi:membrane protease YdiL (CAAX protease family)